MCGVCGVDGEVHVDEAAATCEFVCGVDVAEDSEDNLVTTEFRSLRDIDGWQRRDPWGGSTESRPKRATVSSHDCTYSLVYLFFFIYLGLADCHIYDFSICWVKGGAPSL